MKNLTDRQSQIITESINIISKQGIQGLTIKNLSKSIGISEPAIYRHFDSKIDILLTILETFQQDRQFSLTKIAVDNISALEKLEKIYLHNFRNFAGNPALAAVIFSEEIFRNDPRLSDKVLSIMSINQKVICNILENGQSNSEIRVDISAKQLALIIMGALRLFVTQWRFSGFSFDLEKEGAELWDTIEKIVSLNR